MKKLFRNQNLWALLLLVLLAPLSSCSDDDDGTDPNLVQYNNLPITASQEVPPNTSPATGTFSGTYNKTTNILTYTITFTGITPTNMHFHKGEPGVSGGVEIGIGSPPYTSPIQSQTPALTTEQENDLLAGRWYVNIHSAAFPAGEIRGQVVQ